MNLSLSICSDRVIRNQSSKVSTWVETLQTTPRFLKSQILQLLLKLVILRLDWWSYKTNQNLLRKKNRKRVLALNEEEVVWPIQSRGASFRALTDWSCQCNSEANFWCGKEVPSSKKVHEQRKELFEKDGKRNFVPDQARSWPSTRIRPSIKAFRWKGATGGCWKWKHSDVQVDDSKLIGRKMERPLHSKKNWHLRRLEDESSSFGARPESWRSVRAKH